MKNIYLILLATSFLAACNSGPKTEQPSEKESSSYTFTNGYPKNDEVSTIYNELDYQRAVQSYLWAVPAVAGYSFVEGLKRDYKADMYTVNIWETSAHPNTTVFTGNSQSIYCVGYYDLSETGPFVMEFPPAVLGMIDDLWYTPITDVGLAGPDKGKGGKYLVLPANYTGEVPEGYFTYRSTTNLNIWLVRGFKGKDGSSPVESLKGIKVYPLSKANNQPEMKFTMVSDMPADLTFPTDERFFDALGQIISKEPVREKDMAYRGMLQSLGMEYGKPYAPDERLKSIFKKASKTGNAMARTIAFSSRNKSKEAYTNRQWEWIFLTESPTFYTPNYLDIEARITYTYQACFTADAMVMKLVDAGSQYLACYKDADSNWLDGSHTYKLTLPKDIPVKQFWSLMVYSSDTRSMIVNDTHNAGIDSYGELKTNTDGSIDLYLGPKAPEGFESNWVQSNPGEGFFLYFRFYGPTQEFFDKTWVIGDLVKEK